MNEYQINNIQNIHNDVMLNNLRRFLTSDEGDQQNNSNHYDKTENLPIHLERKFV